MMAGEMPHSGQELEAPEQYFRRVADTDEMDASVGPIVMGLFGEVGSLMSVSKKRRREGKAYVGYREAELEEFGDILWYFLALCRRLERPVEETIRALRIAERKTTIDEGYDDRLLALGEGAAALLRPSHSSEVCQMALQTFASLYAAAVREAGLGWPEIVESNWRKVSGRFLDSSHDQLPTFDAAFLEEERLPEKFEIKILERQSGQAYMRWNGVFIGDPLTDNMGDADGYRFHDVFHMAHAAVLHWSPVFRKLIKQKRKSNPRYDEQEDSGRAIVVEEGLTAWVFSRAKEMELFAGCDRLLFGLLKTIQKFVKGYEVARCPLSLWERTILDGYGVFRSILENRGGTVIGDRRERSIAYRK